MALDTRTDFEHAIIEERLALAKAEDSLAEQNDDVANYTHQVSESAANVLAKQAEVTHNDSDKTGDQYKAAEAALKEATTHHTQMVSDLAAAQKAVVTDNDAIVDHKARIDWGVDYLKPTNAKAQASHVKWMSSRIADQTTLADAKKVVAHN